MAYAILSCLRLETYRLYRQDAKFHSLFRVIQGSSTKRVSFCLRSRDYATGVGGPASRQIELQQEDGEENSQSEKNDTRSRWSPTLFKMFESAATTIASILVLGLAGYGYHRVRRPLEQDDASSDRASTCKP